MAHSCRVKVGIVKQFGSCRVPPLSRFTPNLEAVDGGGCLVCHLHEINWWGPRAVGKNHPIRSSHVNPNRTVRPPLIASRPCPVRPRDDLSTGGSYGIRRRLAVENQRAHTRPIQLAATSVPPFISPVRLFVRLPCPVLLNTAHWPAKHFLH